MPLATASAIAEIATVLFVAPLVLGAYVVLQGAGWRVSALYFGLLSVLLVLASPQITFAGFGAEIGENISAALAWIGTLQDRFVRGYRPVR